MGSSSVGSASCTGKYLKRIASFLSLCRLFVLVIILQTTQYDNYSCSIYVVLGIVHNLEIKYTEKCAMHMLYAKTTLFYKGTLISEDFGILGGL